MRIWTTLLGLAASLPFYPTVAFARTTDPVSSALAPLGANAIRQADYDLCLPATAEEYEKMGKNGVLRIEAASVLSTELPIKAAYLQTGSLKIPLRLIASKDLKEDPDSGNPKYVKYWRQVFFYTVPLNLLKSKPEITIDFSGERRDFGIGTLELDASAPAFVRLNEYDSPTDPDTRALASLLVREYPNEF